MSDLVINYRDQTVLQNFAYLIDIAESVALHFVFSVFHAEYKGLGERSLSIIIDSHDPGNMENHSAGHFSGDTFWESLCIQRLNIVLCAGKGCHEPAKL